MYVEHKLNASIDANPDDLRNRKSAQEMCWLNARECARRWLLALFSQTDNWISAQETHTLFRYYEETTCRLIQQLLSIIYSTDYNNQHKFYYKMHNYFATRAIQYSHTHLCRTLFWKNHNCNRDYLSQL